MLRAGGASMPCLTCRSLCSFFGPHVRCSLAFPQDQRLHRLVRTLRKRVGPAAARLQSLQPRSGITFQMLVAGLAADAELFAARGTRKPKA